MALGRYREGLGTITDLLVAQGVLADARAQQIEARWGWFTALAQLAHDVGVMTPNAGSLFDLITHPAGEKP